MPTGRATKLTSVDILLYIQKLWKDGYEQFPHLAGLSPAQVLAKLPNKHARYRQGEAGLIAILREIK